MKETRSRSVSSKARWCAFTRQVEIVSEGTLLTVDYGRSLSEATVVDQIRSRSLIQSEQLSGRPRTACRFCEHPWMDTSILWSGYASWLAGSAVFC